MSDNFVNVTETEGTSWQASAQLPVHVQAETHLGNILHQAFSATVGKAEGLTVPPGSYRLRVLAFLASD